MDTYTDIARIPHESEKNDNYGLTVIVIFHLGICNVSKWKLKGTSQELDKSTPKD